MAIPFPQIPETFYPSNSSCNGDETKPILHAIWAGIAAFGAGAADLNPFFTPLLYRSLMIAFRKLQLPFLTN
jgi:hypothetical protein